MIGNGYKRLPEYIKLIKDNWRSGDLDALSKSAFVLQMKTEFPALYKVMVNKRNNAWMERLPSLINETNRAFVLVGAMHLNGQKSLINLLKLQGFQVEHL